MLRFEVSSERENKFTIEKKKEKTNIVHTENEKMTYLKKNRKYNEKVYIKKGRAILSTATLFLAA